VEEQTIYLLIIGDEGITLKNLSNVQTAYSMSNYSIPISSKIVGTGPVQNTSETDAKMG